jgi:glucosamine 6-phosphate synthetase-like amidotransferase/phosphosugar isomerase protein
VLVGVGDHEYFVASDASAILEHTRSVVYLNDGDIAVLTPDGYRVMDRQSQVQERAVNALGWDLAAVELGGHAHFMLKEILEQPETVRSTLRGRLAGSTCTRVPRSVWHPRKRSPHRLPRCCCWGDTLGRVAGSGRKSPASWSANSAGYRI